MNKTGFKLSLLCSPVHVYCTQNWFLIIIYCSLHLWSSWTAVGLTKDSALPDFSAMYSGTPDSAWFVRREMGHTMEFSDGELILVVESDASTAKPVVRLSVVPLKTDQVAKSIQYR